MSYQYLLDTNICIYIANRKPQKVLEKLSTLHQGDIAMSAITYGELYYGIRKSKYKKRSLGILQNLIKIIPPLNINEKAAEHYGTVRQQLEAKGLPIGNNDLWIAAHALSLGIPIVTNNEKEFKRICTLKVENWTR